MNNIKIKDMKCTELVGELFRARDIIHLEHLYSDKWSSHIILDSLYDQVLEGADMIAELVLSRGSSKFKIEKIPESVNIIKYLEEKLVPLLDEAKETADKKDYNDISATIDEVKRSVQSALYKLKRLSKSHSGEHSGEQGMVEYKRQGGVLYQNKIEKTTRPQITKR